MADSASDLPLASEDDAVSPPAVASAPAPDQGRPEEEIPRAAKASANPKTADKPHFFTMALSGAALLISLGSAALSYLSLQETRANRAVTEETSRAYVKIVSFLLETPVLLAETNWAGKFVTGSITLTNTGRVSATHVRALLDTNPPRFESVVQVAQFDELVPGASPTTSIRFRLEDGRGLTFASDTKEYSLNLRVEYDAGLQAGPRTDNVFFCVPRPKKGAKGLSLLTACDTHYDLSTFR